MSDDKKDDNGMGETETLLDYVEAGGYKVKPWGITELAELSPHLERVMKNLQERGITLEGAKTGVGFERIIFSVLPEMPAILEVTLAVSREELKKIPNDKMFEIVFAIFQINIAYLKNLLGPIQNMTKKILA